MAHDQTNSETPKVAEPDLSGRRLGDYQLLRRLGRGGMAEVWLAEQSSLKRQVAIKVLRSDLASDELYIRRFENEAQSAAQLAHPNIVQIYEVGCVESIHYIAQEYVPGQNLREYMVKHGPPETKFALSIMRQVSAALHKAAEQGIIHRDIKPENIMLSSSGEVKVADFGLARLVGDGGLNLTQVGMTMGTPLYMSPEQVEGKKVDPRSDIYSFGVTCYHMLAGVPPFRGESALSVAVQHMKSRPEPLEELRPDLPSGLCRIVHKMLAKEPPQRYASGRELLRDLRKLRSEEADLLGTSDSWDDLDSLGLDFTVTDKSSLATQRLAGAMHNETMQIPQVRKKPWGMWVGMIAICFLLGSAAAYSFRERPLLSQTGTAAVLVPKQKSAFEQYLMAVHLDNEVGWKSVIEHFPEETGYVRRAKQQLARLYLYRLRDYDAALLLFDELAGLPDKDFKAFGLAGRVITLNAMERYDDAAQTLPELWPIRNFLDAQMSADLRAVLTDNFKRLGEESSQELEQWRGDQFAPGRDS